MARDVRVTVTGFEQLKKGLEGLQGRRLRKVSRQVLKRVGERAQSRARRFLSGEVLNVRTGRLRRALDTDLTDTSLGLLIGPGGSAGTIWESRRPPRPFLRPALEQGASRFEREFVQDWQREIFRGVS